MDIDVASYYPFIMLNENLVPRSMSTYFSQVFRKIVEQRIHAKRTGDKVTADRLKIVVNSSYGLTSSPYSALYDPQCTAGVTVTGQVTLLLLIAMLADTGIRTVSANTDGITVQGEGHMDREKLAATVKLWESWTRYEMEYTEYSAVYQASVNDYIAIKK